MAISIPQNPLRVLANVLTNVGKQIVTGSVKKVGSGPGAAEPVHIAWGSGAGTAAIADTTLFAEETAEPRVAGSSSQQTGTNAGATTNDTYQVTGTVTASAAKTITNAGLFDVGRIAGGTIAGNLFAKGDFTGVSLNAQDSIAFTFRWQLQ